MDGAPQTPLPGAQGTTGEAACAPAEPMAPQRPARAPRCPEGTHLGATADTDPEANASEKGLLPACHKA
eukprot:4912348-Pyramimonas_sp.AAC.1